MADIVMVWWSGINGGAEGVRTPDLLTASQALSQLSYGPICEWFVNIYSVSVLSRGILGGGGDILEALAGGHVQAAQEDRRGCTSGDEKMYWPGRIGNID